MSTFITERNDGTITVSPKNEASQSGLVVISHGLGDTAEGFSDVAEVCSSMMLCVILAAMTCYSITFPSFTVFGKRIALFKIHFTDRSDTSRHDEYGHAHAFLV
jgi:hypothetical protein